jgi:hypothetical protein
MGNMIFASPMGSSASSGSHIANTALLLTQPENRGIPSSEISRKWREEVGDVPGADSVTFVSSLVGFGQMLTYALPMMILAYLKMR